MLKLAKGYEGMGNSTFVKAKERVIKAGQHAYRDRKKKKRVFRSLWIVRLNAALHESDTKYSVFMGQMKKKGIDLNRKTLSEMAIHQPEAFDKLVKEVVA